MKPNPKPGSLGIASGPVQNGICKNRGQNYCVFLASLNMQGQITIGTQPEKEGYNFDNPPYRLIEKRQHSLYCPLLERALELERLQSDLMGLHVSLACCSRT